MKFKTLNDIEEELTCDYSPDLLIGDKVIRSDKLKAEAIKWIKEDIKDLKLYPRDEIIIRWMERLNITEEDLK